METIIPVVATILFAGWILHEFAPEWLYLLLLVAAWPFVQIGKLVGWVTSTPRRPAECPCGRSLARVARFCPRCGRRTGVAAVDVSDREIQRRYDEFIADAKRPRYVGGAFDPAKVVKAGTAVMRDGKPVGVLTHDFYGK